MKKLTLLVFLTTAAMAQSGLEPVGPCKDGGDGVLQCQNGVFLKIPKHQDPPSKPLVTPDELNRESENLGRELQKAMDSITKAPMPDPSKQVNTKPLHFGSPDTAKPAKTNSQQPTTLQEPPNRGYTVIENKKSTPRPQAPAPAPMMTNAERQKLQQNIVQMQTQLKNICDEIDAEAEAEWNRYALSPMPQALVELHGHYPYEMQQKRIG
jgi:hypothetical protein